MGDVAVGLRGAGRRLADAADAGGGRRALAVRADPGRAPTRRATRRPACCGAGEHCFALLNLYPYTAGHLMVLPRRAVSELEGLTAEEHVELWAGVRDAVVALEGGAVLRRGERRREPRRRGRRIAVRPPPRALRAALGRRRQLHRGGRRDPRPPDQPRRGRRAHPGRLACAEPPAGTVGARWPTT